MRGEVCSQHPNTMQTSRAMQSRKRQKSTNLVTFHIYHLLCSAADMLEERSGHFISQEPTSTGNPCFLHSLKSPA